MRAPYQLTAEFGAADWHERLHDRFRAWRETPVFCTPDGAVYLTRHADCARLMSDDAFRRGPEGSSGDAFSAVGDPTPLGRMLGDWVLFMDGERHDRVRAAFAGAFTARALKEMEPRIADTAVRLAAELPRAGTAEIVRDFATALPVFAIADILGVPPADRELFSRWAEQLMEVIDSGAPELIRAGSEVAEASGEYFSRAAAECRRRPGPNLLSALVQANDAGNLSDGEMVGGCVFLLLAGHETTRSLISSGTSLLSARPALWRRLGEEPALLDGAIEEMLRFEAPVQKISRWAIAETDFGDYRVPANTFLVAMLGAGNRDPAVFERPDEFLPERSPNRHLSFGRGRHTCLGAILARMEGRAAFTALLGRYRELAPVSHRWRGYTSVRSLHELRIDLRAA